MSTTPGTPSFAQLQVLLAVADAGSFAAAARRLNRATSAITYAIDNLEAQLGLPLFDRVATRKPELTQAGRAVLAEARAVTHGVDMLRAKVKGLLEGLEAEVSLAVDVMLPTARLVDAPAGLPDDLPDRTVAASRRDPGRRHAARARRHGERSASAARTWRRGTAPRASPSAACQLVPVAAPFHPLARLGGQARGSARDHIQLVLTDRSKLTEGQDFGVVGPKTWRLADLGAKHALLLAASAGAACPRRW